MKSNICIKELKLYTDEKHVDDIYWQLYRAIQLRFSRAVINQENIFHLNGILADISMLWGLKYPLKALYFGLNKGKVRPLTLIKISLNKIYSEAMNDLIKFYQQPENRFNAMNDLEIIFEIDFLENNN